MIKNKTITIFEDSPEDLIRRYSNLTKDNKVKVYLDQDSIESLVFSKGYEHLTTLQTWDLATRLTLLGFDTELTIFPGFFWEKRTLDSDLYFIDGLNGNCLPCLEYLPIEKTYLVSGNPMIEEEVRKHGYKTLNEFKSLHEQISF